MSNENFLIFWIVACACNFTVSLYQIWFWAMYHYQHLSKSAFQSWICKVQLTIPAFLDFRGFNLHNFWFYNSILFSSPLVLISNLDLHGFLFLRFFLCPHINSVNQGMPVNKLLFQVAVNTQSPQDETYVQMEPVALENLNIKVIHSCS